MTSDKWFVLAGMMLPLLLGMFHSVMLLQMRPRPNAMAIVLLTATAVLGYCWYRNGTLNGKWAMLYGLPLYQFLLTTLLFRYFRRLRGRSPRDTFSRMSSGLFWDRAFSVVAFFGSIIPVFWLQTQT
jgi:hypothetical protein